MRLLTPKHATSTLARHLMSAGLMLAMAGTLCAGDWPNWRGPSHNGISAEKDWVSDWPASGPKVAWKAKVGLGFSSFVVAEGRVATAGHAGGKDTVFCFDAVSGKELWKYSYAAELGDKFYEGGTTGTPTFDGDRLYWLSRWGDLLCFEASSGKIAWSKNIQQETGVNIPTWGFSGAVLVHGNLLILNAGEHGIAVDKSNGKLVWKSENKDSGYSAPLPLERGGKWLALMGGAENYFAVDLKTGQEVWRHRWLTQYGVNATDPIVDGDRVFISTGYGKGGVLLDISSTPPKELWKTKLLRTQFNTAVLHEGHVYGADGDTTQTAALKCLEFATGKEKWAYQGFGSGGVTLADGKLIALSAKGELMVAPASPDGFKPIARAQVLGGKCWTTPVLANGFIYCRSGRGDVVAVDVRKK